MPTGYLCAARVSTDLVQGPAARWLLLIRSGQMALQMRGMALRFHEYADYKSSYCTCGTGPQWLNAAIM